VTSASPLPLAGIRILAPTQLGAGPFGLMFLADLGAEVVKVENPATRGDEARTVPPFNDPAAHDGLYFQALNRGARSLTLNLRHPDGQALLHRLVPRFDAVFNNLRGDQTAALGLDHATLGRFNPRIVCCSLSGFGRTGPRRDEPAYDYLLQAYAGFMSLTGEPDAPPTKSGVSVVDFSGGILAALALMIGLHRARTTGEGADVDVSLLDTALTMLNYMAAWSLDRGWTPARHPDGAHQSIVPSQTFRTGDGWIVVMAMKEKFWQRLIERVDLPELAHDPRFRSFPDRLANRSALIDLLRARFRERTTRDWLGHLRGHVPVAPIYTVAEALADEQVQAREMVIEIPHPVLGVLRQVGSPIKIAGVRPAYRAAAALGADTDGILAEIGIDSVERDRLRAAGVV
jgi:crotonobetainyl-CoA:carnitine CoA-transferase CaiB-like acyl-CoA transferase